MGNGIDVPNDRFWIGGHGITLDGAIECPR
jgi:hypothetical protein